MTTRLSLFECGFSDSVAFDRIDKAVTFKNFFLMKRGKYTFAHHCLLKGAGINFHKLFVHLKKMSHF